MMDSRRKHLPKESAEVRQVQPGVRQGLGPCWEGADDFSCVSVVYLNLYSYLYLCIFPKSQLRLPSATRCEGDLGTMLGSCGWPHRHSVWKAEWHTHYQTTSPFSDHTSAGPWPCSSSNDWDQHIWNDMVSCITWVVGSQQWQLSWCWWGTLAATCLGLWPHCILVNQWIYSINHTGGNHFPWIKPLKQWQHPMTFSGKSQLHHRINFD